MNQEKRYIDDYFCYIDSQVIEILDSGSGSEKKKRNKMYVCLKYKTLVEYMLQMTKHSS